jgi:hypothetical protein
VTVTLALPQGKKRYFSGICSRASQGERNTTFTNYRLDIVPQFWLLTRRRQSRIFQHVAVPEIPGWTSPSSCRANTSRATSACSTGRRTSTSPAA